MGDIYNDIEEYNRHKKCKIIIVFDNIIADMLSNKKINPTVAKLFIKGKKINISLVFITQSYFAVPENIRLNYYENSKQGRASTKELIIH